MWDLTCLFWIFSVIAPMTEQAMCLFRCLEAPKKSAIMQVPLFQEITLAEGDTHPNPENRNPVVSLLEVAPAWRAETHSTEKRERFRW